MRKLHIVLLAILAILSGCVEEKDFSQSENSVRDAESTDEPNKTADLQKSNISGLKELQIDLKGIPIHIESNGVGVKMEWSVVLEDGKIQRFDVNTQNGQVKEITEEKNPEFSSFFVKPSSETVIQSELPQPIGNLETTLLQTKEDEFVYVDSNGDLVFWNGEQEVKRVTIDALPDSYLLADDDNRVLVLTQPSTRYDHGIFGDKTEASGFAIIDANKRAVIYEASVPESDVIESLKPLWIDWDQNGTKEIILTLSNDEEGARLVLYDETGKQLAEGQPLGQSHRWRHALTIDAFNSTENLELAEITTPHIGGNLQFIEWDQQNQQLKVIASGKEYSTHSIGSKNLDMYTALDADFDGQIELWVPSQRKDALVSVQRTINGFEPIKQLQLQGTLSSNIVSVSSEQQAVLAAGTDKATLDIWIFTK